MRFSKSRRIRVEEQMDAPDVDPNELRRALGFIRKVNRLLRYNRAVVARVMREASGPRETRADDDATTPGDATRLRRDGAISVLDVATGSGDLLLDLHEAFARRGERVALTGLDLHTHTLDEARALAGGVATLVRGDALGLPFDDQSFDVVTSGLFLHHLSDADAVRALSEMARVARRAVVVADLIRSRRAYAWITLLTGLSSPMIRHDARASVAHAFTIDEARQLARAAGLHDATIDRTFGHRFLLTWRRPRR